MVEIQVGCGGVEARRKGGKSSGSPTKRTDTITLGRGGHWSRSKAVATSIVAACEMRRDEHDREGKKRTMIRRQHPMFYVRSAPKVCGHWLYVFAHDDVVCSCRRDYIYRPLLLGPMVGMGLSRGLINASASGVQTRSYH